ncbi:MAG: hypothetical protein R6V12_06960 [Candidatus Hydrogenedentota bacterium]
MNPTRLTCFIGVLAWACALAAVQAPAATIIDNPQAQLILGENAHWQSLVDKTTGRELVPEDVSLPLAEIRHGGDRFPAAGASLEGDTLTVTFANTDTVLGYTLEETKQWIVFRLDSIAGTRPDSMTLLQVPVSITENVGTRLNAAWDEQTTVCMMAATRQAACRARTGGHAVLRATTQDAPGPPLENAAIAIIVSPTSKFKAIAREASHAFGLLTNEDSDGTPVKDTDLVRGSYWFLSFGEDDVERVIEYSRRAGIRQVMLSSGAWCTSPGHYLFNENRYPNGQDGLKAVVEKLHEHGIRVGMHGFASKVSKRDPYVTPVPDSRLLRGVSAAWRPGDGPLETTLEAPLTAEQTKIVVTGSLESWPGSSAVADRYWEGGIEKHREVIIGEEIIQYEATGPEGEWNTFEGCKRGAWNSTAAAHPAGAEAYHVCVDGCINGYVIDQETDLMDEVADRLAGLFNDCGFDMVYFDGGEDVDRRRSHYYTANFQEQVVKRFTKRPIIHMGTIMTHLVWHSFARSSTVDQYLNTLGGAIIGGRAPTEWPTVKEHIDRSVRYMLSVRQDMMPGELGWFGIWPRGARTYTVTVSDQEAKRYHELSCDEGPVELPSRENTVMTGELVAPNELRLHVEYDGLQLDEIEYLMCKSLGYDVPISLQTSFDRVEAHPLSAEILNIVREYETMRMQRSVPVKIRSKLQELGKDFALIRVDGHNTWVEIERVKDIADTRELRAFVGAFKNGSVATMWHALHEGHLSVELDPKAVQLLTFSGEPLPMERDGRRLLIPMDATRTTLLCPEMAPQQLRAVLKAGELRLREPAKVWLQAADFERLVGEMALGSQVGITEPEAFGDVLVATGQPSIAPARQWYAEYTVDIPHDGLWAIWGRVRYPRDSDDSFGFVVPGEEVTLANGDGQVLGNCGVNGEHWHWTGRGSGSTAVPPGRPLTRRLEAGPFTFRIYAREGPGDPQANPRLDVICLTEDSTHVPTDKEAKAWLARHE